MTNNRESQINDLKNLIKNNTGIIASFKASIEALQKENKEALEKITKLEEKDQAQIEENKKVDEAIKSAKEEADLMIAEILEVQNLLKK
jgi:peptidoglycan hydrolase CwlO-like protein